MKLIQLEAQNVLRLKAVTLNLDGKSVVITGANDQGKTSVLKSIEMLLTGKSSVPGKPIREGEESGYIVGIFDDLVVKRAFTGKDTYLTVQNREGMRYQTPQDILNRMLGRDGKQPVIAFDPLEFSRMNPKQQRAVLLKLVNLELDLDEYGLTLEGLLMDRADANRELTNAEVQMGETPSFPDDTPMEPVSVDKLLAQLATINEQTAHNNRCRVSAAHTTESLHRLDIERDEKSKEVLRLQAAAVTAKRQLQQLDDEQDALTHTVEKQRANVNLLVDADDSLVTASIAAAGEINANVELRRGKGRAVARVVEHRERAKEASDAVAKQRSLLSSAVSKAAMPIDGLAVSTEGVTFEGFPFDQLSDSKKLRVSVSMAMAMYPDLRLLLVDRLELLDDKNRAMLQKMTDEKGYQVIATRVSTKAEPASVHIIDGKVAAIGD